MVRKEQILVHVSEDIKRRVKDVAEKDRRSISETCLFMIEEGLEAREAVANQGNDDGQ